MFPHTEKRLNGDKGQKVFSNNQSKLTINNQVFNLIRNQIITNASYRIYLSKI